MKSIIIGIVVGFLIAVAVIVFGKKSKKTVE
jgi:hypothetical protein